MVIGTKQWRNYDHVPLAATRAYGLFRGGVCETVAANLDPLRMSERATHPVTVPAGPEPAIVAALGPRALVLVGMMGAGKSSIGRRLAQRLGIAFVDADTEI